MKAIKNKWYSLYISVLSVVLGTLGLHSCSKDIYDDHADYHYVFFYMGTVTDENGNPLEGEEVTIKIPGGNDNVHYFPAATLKTNAAGTYSHNSRIETNQVPTIVRVVVIDKDDPEVKDSVDVEPNKIFAERSGDYDYFGTYLVKGDIKLKKNK